MTQLTLVPDTIKLPELKEVKRSDEQKFVFSRHYYFIVKDGKQYITKELLTMVQLLPMLVRQGLDEDRDLYQVDRKEAPRVLSEIKLLEAAATERKEKEAAKRKQKKAEQKRKEEERKEQEILTVEKKVSDSTKETNEDEA